MYRTTGKRDRQQDILYKIQGFINGYPRKDKSNSKSKRQSNSRKEHKKSRRAQHGPQEAVIKGSPSQRCWTDAAVPNETSHVRQPWPLKQKEPEPQTSTGIAGVVIREALAVGIDAWDQMPSLR